MAEYSVDEGLVVGLRAKSDQKRNQQRLVTMKNAIPTENGARPLPAITWPVASGLSAADAKAMAWPYPQFVWIGRKLFLFGETAIYEINTTTWAATAVTVYDAAAPTVESINQFADDSKWSATGWTITEDVVGPPAVPGYATHTPGSETNLIQIHDNQASEIAQLKLYRVRIVVSSMTAGTVTPKIGATSGTAISSSGNHVQWIISPDDANPDNRAFALAPSSAFDGTITEASAKLVGDGVIAAGTGPWRHCTFGDIWFATNGTHLVYQIPSEGPYPRVAKTTITVNFVANHQGRLVVGGLTGGTYGANLHSYWTEIMDKWRVSGENDYRSALTTGKDIAFDKGWIAYSQPGGGAVDFPFVLLLAMLGWPSTSYYLGMKELIDSGVESGTLGLLPLRMGGECLDAAPLGGDLIVYTTNGVSKLDWTQGGYIETPLPQEGLAVRGAMNGDEREHVWLTKQGQLKRWTIGSGVDDLDLREHLGGLVPTAATGRVVVAFDSTERYYSIAGKPVVGSGTLDGLKGFWLTRTGLGGSDAVMPTTLLRHPGAASPYNGLLGLYQEPAVFGGVEIVNDTFDLGDRGTWEIIKVGLATNNATGTWNVSAYWRMNRSEAFAETTPLAPDDRGIAYVKCSGIEARVKVTCDIKAFGNLDRIDVYLQNTANGKIAVARIFDRI